MNKNDTQSIKDLVKLLEKNHGHLLNEHNRVNRPWGWFETVDEGNNFKVKRIQVKSGAKLSYQSHTFRNEHWAIVRGRATIIQNDKQMTLEHDESTFIKMGVKHQLINQEKVPLEIIEVQTGVKVMEDDIVRFKDLYGRD